MAGFLSELWNKPSQKGSPSVDDLNRDWRTCLVCREDLRWIQLQPPFQEKVVWTICDCSNQIKKRELEEAERKMLRGKLESIYKHNLMSEDLEKANFNNFTLREGTDEMYRAAYKFRQSFSADHGVNIKGLLGYGDVGNGKSHLFASIHHELCAEGYVSLFIDCSRLFMMVEDARKFSSKVSINDIINAAIKCDLLTLDELGAGRLTEEEFNDVLFPILNGRQGKATNFTTNLNLDELSQWFSFDKYGKELDKKGRLIDRILGSCNIVENKGTSKRKEDALSRLGE